MSENAMPPASRVGWVDYAKGYCIVLVVMMHATLGVEAAMGGEGWLHYVVAFAKPFRMPDFFLISGLFLARVIDRNWRDYLDRKVVYFAYFYVIWLTIQFAFKAPGLAAEGGLAHVAALYLEAFVEPFGTLWFIYLLPVFFVVTKLVRDVPLLPVWLAAAALEIVHIETSSLLINEFASRFVYFYTGYILAPIFFLLVEIARKHALIAIAALIGWAVANGAAVQAGIASLPVISLVFGMLGVAAVVAICGLMEKRDLLPPLRYCGKHSIVIYLAFFLPMAATRTLFVKTGVITDIGTISAITTITAVIGALAIYWTVRGTRMRVLFERPRMFRLASKPRSSALQPAE
ncbi:MAG: acyltransferase family protein [Rhizobiales bacterium]|nr:acyltransferase family protein [Hyphomicrobiales bacterium]